MFSRGLKLVRVSVYLILVQLALTLLLTISSLGAGNIKDLLDWTRYSLLANAVATLVMCVGAVRAIPELSRARINTSRLVIAGAGLAIAAAALAWTYHSWTSFMDVVADPNSTAEDVIASGESLKSLRYVVIVKDLAYASGLVALLGAIQRCAATNDQLALRDAAGSMGRALIVMLAGDVFYQLTYGVAGGGIGITGVIGSLLIGIYWIYCHLRLAKFLFNAAHLVNELELPVATIVAKGTATSVAPPPPPAPRASRPSVPIPIKVVQPPAPPPRAPSQNDGEGPRFLV